MTDVNAVAEAWQHADGTGATVRPMNTTSVTRFATFGALAVGALPVTATLRGLELGDPTHRRAGRSLRRLARAVVAATGTWDFAVEGTLPDDLDRRPCVVVANHCSLADPFLLAHLPTDLRFVAKDELFHTPLVGWLLRLGGDIPVRRGDHASAVAMTAACVETLRRGLSVMIFPEGTRSRTGELGRFRDGAFRIALATGARIVPVALHGTAACVDQHGPRVAVARAEILPPEAPAGDVDELRDRTRIAIAGALARRAGHSMLWT
jgi:1-acyl-sn-glycerol-3-phosphate acyltransferase